MLKWRMVKKARKQRSLGPNSNPRVTLTGFNDFQTRRIPAYYCQAGRHEFAGPSGAVIL